MTTRFILQLQRLFPGRRRPERIIIEGEAVLKGTFRSSCTCASRRAWRRSGGRCRTGTAAPAPAPGTPSSPPRRRPPTPAATRTGPCRPVATSLLPPRPGPPWSPPSATRRRPRAGRGDRARTRASGRAPLVLAAASRATRRAALVVVVGGACLDSISRDRGGARALRAATRPSGLSLTARRGLAPTDS